MPSNSVGWPPSHGAGEAVSAFPGELLAARPDSLPGAVAAGGDGDDHARTLAGDLRTAAAGADDMTGAAASPGSSYIYGYDSAGNPTLTVDGY